MSRLFDIKTEQFQFEGIERKVGISLINIASVHINSLVRLSSHHTPHHTSHLITPHTLSHHTPHHTTHLITLHTSSHHTPHHTTPLITPHPSSHHTLSHFILTTVSYEASCIFAGKGFRMKVQLLQSCFLPFNCAWTGRGGGGGRWQICKKNFRGPSSNSLKEHPCFVH